MGAGDSKDGGQAQATPETSAATAPPAQAPEPVQSKPEATPAPVASEATPAPVASQATSAPAKETPAPEKKEEGSKPAPKSEEEKKPAPKSEGKGEDKPKKPKAEHGTRLCVKNLAEDTTSDQLKAACEPFGTVSWLDLKTNKEGKCRGFAFVTFSTVEEASKAMASMDKKEIGGKELSVTVAENKGEKGEKGKGEKGSKGKGKGEKNDKGKGKGKKKTRRHKLGTLGTSISILMAMTIPSIMLRCSIMPRCSTWPGRPKCNKLHRLRRQQQHFTQTRSMTVLSNPSAPEMVMAL
jgi:RNA recognition motif-containing protein